MGIYLNPPADGFEDILKDDIYVDKTELIAYTNQVLGTTRKLTCFSRPRRFGKTLNMSIIQRFFEKTDESNAYLFDGLKISKYPECMKYQGQYPVISISLKSMKQATFEEAFSVFKDLIRAEILRHKSILFNSAVIEETDLDKLTRFIELKADKSDYNTSIGFLSTLLASAYGKKVIILIDEYDVPLENAFHQGFYNDMVNLIRSVFESALKTNPSLDRAFLTGCLRVSKESIFTGTNNFVSDTITNSRLNEYFGFVQSEVDLLLKDADLTTQAESIKKWYDGYHFGAFDVYCPWDVMNYLLELQRNPKAKPISYWKNTSDNAIIRSFIDYAGSTITNKLETLMAGGCIVQRVDENLTYDYLHSSEDNLWSTLYLTGYLTKAREEDYKGELPDGMVALMIPNAEIKEIFETTVIKWFDDSTKKWNRNALFDAVWNGDSEGITKEMNALLRRTISYHDYREDFYHAFLAGIFTGAGYMVDSNKEHGEGRSDVVVYDSINVRVAIFEAKYTKVLENLESECDIALQQMDDRMYAKEYEDDYDQILCYGISFFKKRCMVKKK